MELQLNFKNFFIGVIFLSFTYLAYLIWTANEEVPGLEVEVRDVASYLIKSVEIGGHAIRSIYDTHNFKILNKAGIDAGKSEVLTKADLISNHLMIGFLRRFPLLRVFTEEKAEYLTDDEANKYRLGKYENWINLQKILNKFPSRRISTNRLSIWIDPLDATQEFTEGLTKYVSVMACLAIDGQPYFGVIQKPFLNETVFGMVGYGIADDKGMILEKPKIESPKRIVISRSHTGSVSELINKTFATNDFVVNRAGGSGYKILELVRGSADLYLHTTSIKKWDVCAGDAIIRSMGFNGLILDLTEGRPLVYATDKNSVHRGGFLASIDQPYSILSMIRSHTNNN